VPTSGQWLLRALLAAAISHLGAQAQQPRSISGFVQEVEGLRVKHVEVRIDGDGANVTTDSGEFAIPFSGNLKVGYPAVFHVTDWVILQPCELKCGRTYLRAPEAEPIEILVLRRGDRRLISARRELSILGCLIEEEAAKFRPRTRPGGGPLSSLSDREDTVLAERITRKPFQSVTAPANVIDIVYYPPTSQTSSEAPSKGADDYALEAREQFLANQAAALGFSVEELKSALASWSRSVQNPYQKGLAALYNKQYEEAVRYISESIGSSDKETVERYVPLSRAQFELGNYAAAESALRKVLAVHKDDPELLNNLGIVLDAQAEYDKAEEQFDKALTIVESTPGGGDPGLHAALLDNKGLMKYRKGNYKEAELLYDKALAIGKEAGLPADRGVAARRSNLAEVYIEQGKYSEAESLAKSAWDIDERALGPYDIDVATDVNVLAMVYQQQGRYKDAESLYTRALDIQQKGAGAEARLAVAKTQTNLAELYTLEHRYEKAKALNTSALSTKRELLPPDHPSIAISLSNSAELYLSQGSYIEAVKLAKQALTIDDSKPDGNPRYVATDLLILGTARLRQREYDLAKKDLERAKGIIEKMPDKDPQFTKIIATLAQVYYARGEYPKAEPLFEQALITEKSMPTPNAETVATIDAHLARTLRKLGRTKEAEHYEQEAAQIRAKAKAGSKHQ